MKREAMDKDALLGADDVAAVEDYCAANSLLVSPNDRRFYPIADLPGTFARGFRAGLLVGLTVGGSLVAFALWVGVALGSSL